jgi:hypothetical protein
MNNPNVIMHIEIGTPLYHKIIECVSKSGIWALKAKEYKIIGARLDTSPNKMRVELKEV